VIPDFLVSSGGSSKRLAVDAKYKIYDDRKVDSGDIAQTFFYAYAYDHSSQPTALLIYPTKDKSDRRASMMIRQTKLLNGARIHVLGLNIPQALSEIRAQKPGETAGLSLVSSIPFLSKANWISSHNPLCTTRFFGKRALKRPEILIKAQKSRRIIK